MTNYSKIVALAVFVAASAHAQLKITEVESAQADGEHQDWWELTNFGPSPVDLIGYKFDDSSSAVASSITLSTASLPIAPGESIIFVETLTPELFRTWWGAGLSLDTKVITYTGSGLGLGAGGDVVNVWDATDTLVDRVTFGQATAGVSFGYDVDTGIFGGLSQVGIGGAFAAFENGDIGSPGIIVVPEPSSLALLLGSLLVLVLRFRRSSRN
jgi:hypothetical protein